MTEDHYDEDIYEGDDIKLPSGRILYANCGIVGIDDELSTFGGYDDGLVGWPGPLTKEDRHFLADRMIALWEKFKASDDI